MGSKAWIKAWTKRGVGLGSLIGVLSRLYRLRAGGAKIGMPVFISPCKLNGSASRLSIGAGTFVGRVELHLHESITIGKNAILNDGVTIFTASHDLNSPEFVTTKRPVSIGNYAWVASGAIILPGVCIGEGAVVGAGAVVAKNVPDRGIVVGNPSRILLKQRTAKFDYVPAFLVSSVRAWVGERNGL